jgi:uncharacterized protein VirK/YbjX
MKQTITLGSSLEGLGGGEKYKRQAVKVMLRGLLHWRQTRRWLQHLNANPIFSDLVRACPRLILKIYRPYLSKTLSCQQRLDVLIAHYRFVFAQGLGRLVSLAAREPVSLASVCGKSGRRYQIALRAVGILEREGELVLQLSDAEGVIYSAAFSFFFHGTVPAIGIGCIQGPRGDDGLERIREATRDLHGLRPKNLLVRLVRQLGYEYGCDQLILVGNGNRTVPSVRDGRVFADYDALWQELGAEACPNGDFSLGCETLAALDLEAVASKKRSEARKRHALLEEMIAAVRASMAAPRLLPVAPAAPSTGRVAFHEMGEALAAGQA